MSTTTPQSRFMHTRVYVAVKTTTTSHYRLISIQEWGHSRDECASFSVGVASCCIRIFKEFLRKSSRQTMLSKICLRKKLLFFSSSLLLLLLWWLLSSYQNIFQKTREKIDNRKTTRTGRRRWRQLLWFFLVFLFLIFKSQNFPAHKTLSAYWTTQKYYFFPIDVPR